MPARAVRGRALVPGGPPGAEPLGGTVLPSRATIIGSLFNDLRRALRVSLPEAAMRAGTRIDVIEALERGEVRHLPAWPETFAIVTRYTGLAGIDARPVLEAIRREMADEARTLDLEPAPKSKEAGVASPALQRLRQAARSVQTAGHMALAAGPSKRLGQAGRYLGVVRLPASRKSRWGLAVTLPVALAMVLSEAGVFGSLAAAMPPQMSTLMLSVRDAIDRVTFPVKDGLVMIEPDDPRSRKGDKLQIGRR